MAVRDLSKFAKRKRVILDALASPDEEYSDRSPKGSIDEGIKELISEINAVDGAVTTSSCAGRISVFLEGNKFDKNIVEEAAKTASNAQKAVPGGKGMGGRWLFVSHDIVNMPVVTGSSAVLHDLFQLKKSHDQNVSFNMRTRFVRFQFEPMILHVMTASLKHAQRILTAALNAGFRESGVQSLKAFEDPQAFPMVAVRTAGLGLSSIIGYADESTSPATICSMVSEEYLAVMLALGNERFKANAERIARLKAGFVHSISKSHEPHRTGKNGDWEEKQSRASRKRREGLARQKMEQEDVLDQSADSDIGDLFGQHCTL